MLYKRNVIASFDSRNDANLATRELLHAGLGDISLRILPPPSARRDEGRVIVSAIVSSNHAHHAENILGRYGHLDLSDQDRTHWRASTSRASESKLSQLPWGSIVAGGVAMLAGWALMSSRNQPSYARRFSRERLPSRSGVVNSNKRSDIVDMADLGWGDEETPHAAQTATSRGGASAFQSGSPVRPPSSGQGLGSGSGLGAGSGLGSGTGAGSAAQGSGHIAGSDIGVGAGVGGGRPSGAGMAGRDLERSGQRTH